MEVLHEAWCGVCLCSQNPWISYKPLAILGGGQRANNGPLARYVKLQVAHAPGMPGTLSPPPQVSDPDMHQGTCVTHVSWCMPGSLTSVFLWSRWQEKRSRHSRRTRNPQFYVSGKSPIRSIMTHHKQIGITQMAPHIGNNSERWGTAPGCSHLAQQITESFWLTIKFFIKRYNSLTLFS